MPYQTIIEPFQIRSVEPLRFHSPGTAKRRRHKEASAGSRSAR